MCDYLISFVSKLRQLPQAAMMNSVLENFTVLQVGACGVLCFVNYFVVSLMLCCKRLYVYKPSHKLPDDCLKMLYFSFVHPHILYSVKIYANTYTSYLEKLMKLNNKLLRILQKKDRYIRNTELYANYNTLPITDLHCFQILCIIHKFIYHKDLLPYYQLQCLLMPENWIVIVLPSLSVYTLLGL